MHITADFWRSAKSPSDLPRVPTPEIAIAGRSNVGKSSFINRLTNRKKLARASALPGRTSEVVLFQTSVKESAAKTHSLLLADLPGYGFAKVSKAAHRNLQELIRSYVQQRENLSVLCLLNDIRRTPEEDELGIRALAHSRGLAVLVIATKCDKLSNNQRSKALLEIAKGFDMAPEDILISGEKIPIEPIWRGILELVG